MKYMLLIYEDEKYYEEATPQDWEETMVAHNTFTAEAVERKMNPGGDALHPTGTAKTVRFNGSGSTLVTDGPYAETKEQLGGFYILTCDTEEEALEMAKKLPVNVGAVEVRPVMEFDS